ncbi:FkbM family methyltransferase [Luminiphilus sp.]|nr:FkbM family methyltransferase [Luminiphilus sp.]
MFALASLLRSRRRFVDVGANIGIYSYFFSRCFDRVVSFEPIPNVAYRLGSLKISTVETFQIGLSNTEGNFDLYIPKFEHAINTQLASLEDRGGEIETIKVDVRTLDSFNYQDVDLLKIDVEGHESAVIQGAERTIQECRPALLVEIEQRHIQNDIANVFSQVMMLDYAGFFLLEGRLRPISEFRYELHQQPFLSDVMSKAYVNNFIFVPKSGYLHRKIGLD